MEMQFLKRFFWNKYFQLILMLLKVIFTFYNRESRLANSPRFSLLLGIKSCRDVDDLCCLVVFDNCKGLAMQGS